MGEAGNPKASRTRGNGGLSKQEQEAEGGGQAYFMEVRWTLKAQNGAGRKWREEKKLAECHYKTVSSLASSLPSVCGWF